MECHILKYLKLVYEKIVKLSSQSVKNNNKKSIINRSTEKN